MLRAVVASAWWTVRLRTHVSGEHHVGEEIRRAREYVGWAEWCQVLSRMASGSVCERAREELGAMHHR